MKYTYKELLEDLKEMQTIRNRFAHSLAGIHFLGYKEEQKILTSLFDVWHFYNRSTTQNK